MKRLLRNVLTATVVATAGVVASSAQTWTDVTNTTLNNADLSSVSGSGWEKTGNWSDASGTANGTVYVSENYAGWGSLEQTTFAMKQTVTLSAGLYKIEAYALYRGTVGNALLSAASVSGSTTLGSVPIATAGTMSSEGSNDLQKAANSFNTNYNYLNTVFFYLAEGTSVTIGFSGTHTVKQQWFVAGPMKLYKYDDDSTISSSAALNFTSMIFNPSFESGNTVGWTTTSSSDTGARSTSNNTYSMSNSNGDYLFNTWWKGTPCTQTLANLPAGKYELASVVASDGATIYLINGDVTTDYAYTETTDKTVGITLKKEFLLTSDVSNYKIGVVGGANGTAGEHKEYQADGYWWYKCDNFTLTYKGNGVEHYATTQSGDAVADTWYAQEIKVAGSYTLTTNGSATIVYTQNPGLEPDDITDTASNGDVLALEVGTIYYKASANTHLTIEAANYTYNVGSATISHTYVQPGNTVTVTYADAVTNSGESLTINTNNVTFNGQDLTNPQATANGFTFEIPSGLTADTEFTLSIPTGAVGYTNGNTYNEAQNITLKTPAVFDGTYYLKVAGTTTDITDITNVNTSTGVKGKYLSRGNAYGTYATLDKYGLALIITTDKDNNSVLKVFDTQRYYFTENRWDIFADGTGGTADNQKFIITNSNGKLLIAGKNSPNVYFKHNNGDVNNPYVSVYYDGNGTNSGPIILWELESPADHATVMAGYKNAQAAAAAETASSSDDTTYSSLSSVTTVSALEEAVASLGAYVVVGGEAPTSVKEKYQGDQPNPAPETVYSKTLTIPAPGLYRFSMQAFYRAARNADTQAMHTAGADFPPVVLFFGDSETQIKSLYDEEGGTTPYVEGNDAQYNGKYYANNMDAALMMFQEGKYRNDVWFYAPEAGEYTYGVKYLGHANANMQWFIYSPEAVTVTYYGTGIIYVEDGIVNVLGNNVVADINNAITDDIAVLNIEQATNLNDTQIDPEITHPNLLIYAKSTDQVANRTNVIVDGVCSKLYLKKQNHPFFVPKAFTATEARYTVASIDLAGGKFATLMIPFAGVVPTGNAYTLDQGVNTLGGEVKATKVTTVPANSPVLITGYGTFEAEANDINIPVIERGATYTSGELTGVYSTTKAPVGSYVLQNHTSVAFYLVNDMQPNVGPFRAYIKPQASNAKALRVIFINGDDTTGIGTLHNDGTLTMDNAEYYTVGGARLSAPQKGLNVVRYSNGIVKKIFVK